jgi:hypothetical protein
MSDFGLFLLFFAALACMVGVIRFFAWLTDIQESGGFVAAIQRAQDRYLINKADRVMSNSAPVKEYEQPDPVYIPVPHTSMPASGIPDIDAEKPEMPRLSRDITDNEMLFFLAVVRNIGMASIVTRQTRSMRYSVGIETAYLPRSKRYERSPRRPNTARLMRTNSLC